VLRRVFPGDRAAVRAATVAEALALAREMLPRWQPLRPVPDR